MKPHTEGQNKRQEGGHIISYDKAKRRERSSRSHLFAAVFKLAIVGGNNAHFDLNS